MQKIFVVVMAVLLIGGNSRATDSTKFGVTSYVPERFQDLEWRLNGNFDFRGTNTDNKYTNGASELSTVRRAGTISSQLKYDWYTLKQYTSFALDINGDIDYQHERGNYTNNSTTIWSASNFSSSQTELRLYGSPRIEIGRYIVRDAFVALMGEGEFERGERRYHSLSHEERHDTSSFVSGGTYRNRIWRVESHVHLAGGWSIGWGRVHSGAYAVTALEVISDLGKAGLLLREPTRAEYRELCDTIYSFRRQHYFDGRERQIDAVKSISNQLIQAGIIRPEALSVLRVLDVWTYYPRNDRPFGWRVYGGPVAIWDWKRTSPYQQGYWDRNGEYSRGAWGFRATAEYFRPITLRLQGEATADVYFVADDWRIRQSAKHYIGYRLSGAGKYLFDARTSAFLHMAGLRNPSPLDGLPVARESASIPYAIRVGNGWDSKATEFSIGINYRLAAPTTLTVSLQEYQTTAEPNFANAKFRDSGYYFSFAVTHWLY